jgi:hypothetical protein
MEPVMKRAFALLALAAVAYGDVGYDGAAPAQIPVGLLDDGGGEFAVFSFRTRRWEPIKGGSVKNWSNASCIYCDGKFVLWGFRGGQEEDVDVLDLKTHAWSKLDKPPIEPRMYLSAAIDGPRFAVWGGHTRMGMVGDGAIYDFTKKKWESIGKAPIDPRYYSGVTWVGRRLFVWGGYTNQGPINDGALYDPARGTWQKVSDSGLEARHGMAVAAVKNKVFVWGGYTNQGPASDGAIYDTERDTWEKVPPAPIESRAFTQPAVIGNKIYVFFGYGMNRRVICPKDGAVFDIASRSWRAIPEAPIEGRYFNGLSQAGGKVYVWGGMNHTGMRPSDCAVFDTRSDRWEKIDELPVQGRMRRNVQMFYR